MDPSSYAKLQEITNLFNDLAAHIDNFLPQQSLVPSLTNDFVPPSLALDIPTPTSLIQQLVALGAPYDLAAELSRVYSSNSSDLAHQYRRIYSKFCSDVAFHHATSAERHDALVNRLLKISRLYHAKLQQWEMETEDLVRVRVQSTSLRNNTPKESSNKRTFNHNFVPYLETFFAENQFPSRADRAYLAKKSEMSLSQITIWFQNRRARTRRDKSKCKQESTDSNDQTKLSPRTASDEVETDCETTDVEQTEQTWSRASSFTLVGDADPFDQELPPNAYPTKYTGGEDRCDLARKTIFDFPKIVWPRRGTQLLSSLSNREADVKGLAEAFEKLYISNVQSNLPLVDVKAEAKFGVDNSRDGSGYDVTSFYTTRPLPAPLPAFIRPRPSLRNSKRNLQLTAKRHSHLLPCTPRPPTGSRNRSTASHRPHELLTWKSENAYTMNTVSLLGSKSPRKKVDLPKRLPQGLLASDKDALTPVSPGLKGRGGHLDFSSKLGVKKWISCSRTSSHSSSLGPREHWNTATSVISSF